MKKLSILLITLSLISPMAYSQNHNLLPELREFIELKPLDETRFKDNAYIGLMGLTYPKDNWQTAYEEILIHNDPIVLNQIKQGKISQDYFSDPMKTVFKIKDQMAAGEKITIYDTKKLASLEDLLNKEEKTLNFHQAVYENEKYPHPSDLFPCQNYTTQNCVTTLIERKDYVKSVIQENKEMLKRFKKVINNSTHYDIIIHDGQDFVEAAFLNYRNIQRIFHLMLAEAVIDISEEKIDEGIDKLVISRRWIDFSYQAITKPTLIDLTQTFYLTQSLDQTMNALLDSNLLDKNLNNPKLDILFSPYDSYIGNKTIQTIIWEFSHSLKQRYYPFVEIYTAPLNDPKLSIEDDFIIATYLEEQGYELPPKLKKLSKDLVLKADPSWKKAEELQTLLLKIDEASNIRINADIDNMKARVFESQPAPYDKSSTQDLKQSYDNYVTELNQWYQKYFEQLKLTPKELISYLNTKYPSIEYFNTAYEALQILQKVNEQHIILTPEKSKELVIKQLSQKNWELTQETFGKNWSDTFHNYWGRAIEPQNYHQLVYLKYLILKNQIPTDDIPVFLESQGDLAKNTVTKEPYSFDIETRILSTPLPEDKRHIPTSIRSVQNKNNDQSIQNFEVKIK